MSEDKALTVSGNGYTALTTNRDAVVELIRANLGNSGVDRFDLDRLRMPSGGSLSWEVPTLKGDVAQKSIEGIVLAHRTTRVYWSQPLEDTGGQQPPDCASDDGFTGLGDPGGICKTCPFNAFGSAAKGAGKACKEIRLLFLLMPGELLPVALGVTPGSLKAIKNYLFKLARAGFPHYTVTTILELEKAQSREGIKYAKLNPSMGRKLEGEEIEGVRAYVKNIHSVFEQRVDLRQDEVDGEA